MDADQAVLARSAVASILGGMTFAIGWWILIDGYSYGSHVSDHNAGVTAGYAWLPPFGATIMFLMINGMRWSELREDVTGDAKAAAKAKLFLILALFIACGSVVGAAVLMNNKFTAAGVDSVSPWTGISCLVSTLVIVLAAWIMRLGTLPPSE